MENPAVADGADVQVAADVCARGKGERGHRRSKRSAGEGGVADERPHQREELERAACATEHSTKSSVPAPRTTCSSEPIPAAAMEVTKGKLDCGLAPRSLADTFVSPLEAPVGSSVVWTSGWLPVEVRARVRISSCGRVSAGLAMV